MHRTRTALAMGLAVILSVSVASAAFALGEDEDPELAYCQSVATLQASVANLMAIDTGSTTDELSAAVEGVQDAASTYMEDLRSVAESQVAAIEDSVNALRDYRDDLEGDVTIEEAVQGAIPYVAGVAGARAAAGSVDCQEVLAGEAVEQQAAEAEEAEE